MKKLVVLLLSLSMIFALSACGSANDGNSTEDIPSDSGSDEAIDKTDETETTDGKTLVVHYSATGNTEEAANYIAAATGADVFELVPADPYSDADLDWPDDDSRVVYEHDNPDARAVELVESTVADWESYDTVFIGYPQLVVHSAYGCIFFY